MDFEIDREVNLYFIIPLLAALGTSHNPQFHQAWQLYPSAQTKCTSKMKGRSGHYV